MLIKVMVRIRGNKANRENLIINKSDYLGGDMAIF